MWAALHGGAIQRERRRERSGVGEAEMLQEILLDRITSYRESFPGDPP